jgi:cytochrome c oxidase subunit 2
MFTLFILAIVAAAVIFSIDISDRAAERAAEEQEAATPHLNITASNFKFDKPVYEVKAGSKLKVTLKMAEGVHAAEIMGYNVKLDMANPTQEVTFDKPGEYELACILVCGPGHDDMHSKIVVK